MATDNNIEKISSYINTHSLAVLSTIGEDGTPHGAVVYVYADDKGAIYFLTKNGTQKYRNLLAHPHAALTIFSEADSSTLQADGHVTLVEEPQLIDTVITHLTRAQANAPEWLPPLAKLRAGSYELFGLAPRRARLAEFAGKHQGDNKQIFTEIE